VIVVAAIWMAGPAEVWAALSKADVRFVGAAIALAIPMAIIKGVRWWMLLRNYEFHLSFIHSTGMYAIGMVLSAVTPGHAGDLVKILLLTRRGCGIAKAIASNVLDRVFDVLFVLLASYGGMWYFSQEFASQLGAVNVAFAVVSVLALAIVWKRHLIQRIAIKSVPSQYRQTAVESWNEIVASLFKNRLSRILWPGLLTIVFWVVQFSAFYLCARALAVDVSFVYFSACAAVAMLLSLLPITVAGVGTRDATYVLLLGQIGITQQQSLALSALVLAVFLANSAVFYAVSVACRSDRTPHPQS
jgi:uncharacterized protein (TIRG00374 family)